MIVNVVVAYNTCGPTKNNINIKVIYIYIYIYIYINI